MKNLIQNQETQTIKSKKTYGKYVDEHEGKEPVEANPDILPESESYYNIDDASKETQQKVHKLLVIAKQILTVQQYKVFDLLAIQCKTEREVAKLLNVSQQRVNQHWKSARHKLQRAYNDRINNAE